nr:MAG TPA: hypothetical protein [Caudoviricetes sp.]
MNSNRKFVRNGTPPFMVHGFKRQCDDLGVGITKYVYEGDLDDKIPEYRKFILRHNDFWDNVFFYMIDDNDNIKGCYVVENVRPFCQDFVYLIRVNSLCEVDCGFHALADRVVIGYKDVQDVIADNLPDVFVGLNNDNEIVCYRYANAGEVVKFYITDDGIEVSHSGGIFLVSDCTAKSLVTVVKNVIGDGLEPSINRKSTLISL